MIIYLRSRSDFYMKIRKTKEKSSKEEHVLGVFDLHIIFSSCCMGQDCNHVTLRFLFSL